MGVKVSYGHEARVAPPGWLVAGLMALWIVCAFATATSAARPTGQSAADSSVLSRDPLEIRSIDLREGAPGLFLDVMATGPVVWTSFRDADGRLIVELPNTEPAQGVTGLSPAKGLVAAVGLERGRASEPSGDPVDDPDPTAGGAFAVGRRRTSGGEPVSPRGQRLRGLRDLPREPADDGP